MNILISLSSNPLYALAYKQGDNTRYRMGDTFSDENSPENEKLRTGIEKLVEMSDEADEQDVKKLIREKSKEIDDAKEEERKENAKKDKKAAKDDEDGSGADEGDDGSGDEDSDDGSGDEDSDDSDADGLDGAGSEDEDEDSEDDEDL